MENNFPDLQWIQNQDSKKLFGYGIGMFLLAGKLARIPTDFLCRRNIFFLAFRYCCSFGHRSPQIPRPNSKIDRPSHSIYQRFLILGIILFHGPFLFGILFQIWTFHIVHSLFGILLEGFPWLYQRKNHDSAICFLQHC